MVKTTHSSTHLVEVFKTEAGCIYQADLENCLYVEFGGKRVKYNIGCFIRLKLAVEKIDLARMASDTTRAADFEIISICACEHCYVLTLAEIVAFKELLQGAQVMMQLNSIIRERLHRVIA